MNNKKASIVKKVELAWKKWNDGAVKQAEKDVIAETIRKMLKKYNLEIDWKTGKVTEKQASKEEPKKEEPKKKKSTKKGMSTGDLIKFIFETYGDEWTGKNLRRKIRQIDKWNDGKMTHYDFTEADVKEILIHLGYKVS